MNLIDHITSNAARLGLDVNSDEFKAIITNPTLASVEVPQSYVDAVSTKLMTESEAKINVGLKKYFTAMSLNPVDTTLKELVEEYGLDEETKNVLNAEQNSYSRLKLFTKALADTKEKAASATGSDKKALLEEVKKLQDALNQEKQNATRLVEEVNSKWTTTLTAKEIENIFNGYDYAMAGVPKEVQVMTARNMFEMELKNKGGKVKYEDGKVKLVSSESEDLPFSIDNKQVDTKQFADIVVAPMLKKHGSGSGSPAPTPTPTPQPTGNAKAKQAAQKALADLTAGGAI